ncbi:hypothetical protein EYF80_033223 [Liparis tanakae]|uniref:Uncharacterized protein n=1 Tax=Liparis tanakae TaxID=230148 RepID=A0A4Z2GSD5_9TELE|nr:hypothetical protein EYF80_033223 [Liparis tanakae]
MSEHCRVVQCDAIFTEQATVHNLKRSHGLRGISQGITVAFCAQGKGAVIARPPPTVVPTRRPETLQQSSL